MEEMSLGGSKYFFLLVDDYRRFCLVCFTKSKPEAFGCFRAFKALVEKHAGCQIKALRTNSGGEFISNEFKHFGWSLGSEES